MKAKQQKFPRISPATEFSRLPLNLVYDCSLLDGSLNSGPV
jgi:hypothetical protein